MEYSDTEHYKRQMAEMNALLDAKENKAQGGAKNKMEENEKVETVGNYNPVTGKWESGFREATVYEEPEEDPFADKHPELKQGDLLPKEDQPENYNPLTGKYEKAGYSEDAE